MCDDMKEVTLKIKHYFDAAHKLNDYEGKCANLHGHRWHVTVFARGIPNNNGMLIDFTKVKGIIDELDHKYLNDLVDFNPTAENLAIYLLNKFEKIDPQIDFKVRLWESPTCSVEVSNTDF